MDNNEDLEHVREVFRAFLDLEAYKQAKAPLPKIINLLLINLYHEFEKLSDPVEILFNMTEGYYIKHLKKPCISEDEIKYCLAQLMAEGPKKMASHRNGDLVE